MSSRDIAAEALDVDPSELWSVLVDHPSLPTYGQEVRGHESERERCAVICPPDCEVDLFTTVTIYDPEMPAETEAVAVVTDPDGRTTVRPFDLDHWTQCAIADRAAELARDYID